MEKIFISELLKNYVLNEDEFLNEEGLPCCKDCKTARYLVLNVNNEKKIILSKCKCQTEAMQTRLLKEEQKRKEEEFLKGQQSSQMGKKYLSARFSKAVMTKNNQEAYQKCMNYAKNSKQALNNNFGLYIYGDNSSGKSYLMACLCNELISQGYNCLYTSVPRMLAEIQNSYIDDAAMSQARLTLIIEMKDFVFIDDLGKEFLGRENNAGAVKFAEKVLLEVLNARYNNGKPTIFSSNYSITELVEAFALDKAIIERINEMSTRVIRLEGDDFREKELKEKSELAKRFGI